MLLFIKNYAANVADHVAHDEQQKESKA